VTKFFHPHLTSSPRLRSDEAGPLKPTPKAVTLLGDPGKGEELILRYIPVGFEKKCGVGMKLFEDSDDFAKDLIGTDFVFRIYP